MRVAYDVHVGDVALGGCGPFWTVLKKPVVIFKWLAPDSLTHIPRALRRCLRRTRMLRSRAEEEQAGHYGDDGRHRQHHRGHS